MAQVGLVTGSFGLIGSHAAQFLSEQGVKVVGIDNDMRASFFGAEASTSRNRPRLEDVPGYQHEDLDIRDQAGLERVFSEFSSDIRLIIHAAAQPSHDWAAREPEVDFEINAAATLGLLELTRRYCPEAVFIFLSTNKVYGDKPNALPLVERETRWDLEPGHPFFNGIDETIGVDQCSHSVFGASKLAADIMVQEYGRCFGMKTACLRGGCLTGPGHAGCELHGFFSYLMRCCLEGRTYRIFGYQGKQVRDHIHARDVAAACWAFYQAPRRGAVYNIGGGRERSCSLREAIALCEGVTGQRLTTEYVDQPRYGDHIWYISSCKKFEADYPQWRQGFALADTVKDIYRAFKHGAEGGRA